jgi:general secretion pathway protein G
MALLLCAVAGAGLSAAGRVRAAQDQLDAFEVEIAALAAERGALPGQLGELGWRLAAIAPQRRPLDPWGGMWVYRVPGGDGRAYDLGSYGPDAKLGGGDDIGRPFDRSRPPASGQASE